MPAVRVPEKLILCLVCLFACAGYAQSPDNRRGVEPRTWTFRQDGKIETQSGEWTFKRGGRVEGRFIRVTGSDVVVVQLALDGKEGRLSISNLCDEDLLYLSALTGQTLQARYKRDLPRPKKSRDRDLVETKYDEATGQTTYRQKQPLMLLPEDGPRTLTIQPYVLASVPGVVAMHLVSRCPAEWGWQYLKERRLAVISEEGKKDFGEPRHFGTVGDGYLLEQFTPCCTVSEFKKFASAQHVEIRLGNDLFKLSYDRRAAWRALIELVDTQRLEEYGQTP
jgi:hypothetical protein